MFYDHNMKLHVLPCKIYCNLESILRNAINTLFLVNENVEQSDFLVSAPVCFPDLTV